MSEIIKDRAGRYDWRLILRGLWWGWLLSIPVIVIVNVAILAYPHIRGIGFRPELRFGINASVCLVFCVLATLRYQQIGGASRNSRLRFTFDILLTTALILFVLARQRNELELHVLSTMAALALSILVIVPGVHRISSFPKIAIAVVYLLGALEVFGIGLSLASERVGSSARIDPHHISKDTWNVEHRFLRLRNGANIHYIDEGQGPVLLFLHGNPSYSFQWRGLVQHLHGSFRCIALDYPGFGFSSAPSGFGFTPAEETVAVEEFVDQLQLQEITLVMQDWGGPIGLAFAERRPELIRRVILGNTWAWPSDSTTSLGKFSVIAGGPVGEFLQMSFNGVTRMGIQNGIRKKLPAAALNAYIAPSIEPNKRGVGVFYPGQINQAREFFQGVEGNLGTLRDKKALIFWGLRDVGFPSSDIQRFRQVFSSSRVVTFPDADHFFFEDEEDKMLPEIQSFMSETQRASTR